MKLLQIVANLLPLIFAAIKEIRASKVRDPAACAQFYIPEENVKRHLLASLSGQ